MNPIIAKIEEAIQADLAADSGFDPATDEARAYYDTNMVQAFPAGAANLEAAFTALFLQAGGITSGRIDWQKIQSNLS